MTITVLKNYAPLKKKVFRANHVPYVNKALRKAIMKRSYLKNSISKKGNQIFEKYKET